MEKLTLDFIRNAVSGSILAGSNTVQDGLMINEISTDTRKIKKGSLFIAIRGERFDGHDYIKDAFKDGAAAVISEKEISRAQGPVIIVKDTKKALLALAGAYRKKFNIPCVGVTGSVGKTSTKEMVYAVLSGKLTTHKNEGNLNNEIGLPMSVFGLESYHQAAVFEMGMNGFGEISRLSRTALPTIGLITNIGLSHIGKLGSQENILRAKLEILDGMDDGSTLVLNGDDKLLKNIQIKRYIKVLRYGISNKECGITAENIREGQNSIKFDIKYPGDKIEAEIPCVGLHHVYNALAGFTIGLLLGLSPKEAVEGFGNFRNPGMRQRTEERFGILFIEDCYNASPDSMTAAFDVLKTVGKGRRKVGVLADMLELGDHAMAAHRFVGEAAAKSGIDLLVAYGDSARYYCEGFSSIKPGVNLFFDNRERFDEALKDILTTGDAVLFKGSRGMQLEDSIQQVLLNLEQKSVDIK